MYMINSYFAYNRLRKAYKRVWLAVGRTILRGLKQSCSVELLFVITQSENLLD